MKTASRFVPVGKASAEGCFFVGAHDAEIAQCKVFEIILGLAEIEEKQKLYRSRVIECDETTRNTMLGGDRKRDMREVISNKFWLRPGFADVSAPRRLRAGHQRILWQA